MQLNLFFSPNWFLFALRSLWFFFRLSANQKGFSEMLHMWTIKGENYYESWTLLQVTKINYNGWQVWTAEMNQNMFQISSLRACIPMQSGYHLLFSFYIFPSNRFVCFLVELCKVMNGWTSHQMWNRFWNDKGVIPYIATIFARKDL